MSDQDLALDLLRRGGAAALGTLDADGAPFVSHVATAPAGDGAPLLLISALARHAVNIARDPRVSLLIVGEGDDPASTALPRLTVTGRAAVDPTPEVKALYLARLPEAELYASFADFSVQRIVVAGGYLVAGFGRIVTLSPAELGFSA